MYVTLTYTVATTRTVVSVFIPSIIKIYCSGTPGLKLNLLISAWITLNSEVFVSGSVSVSAVLLSLTVRKFKPRLRLLLYKQNRHGGANSTSSINNFL